MRGRTVTALTHRFRDGVVTREPDELIVEEPLAIDLDGTLVATTMRTPGHDFELAAGFCFTDGLLAGAPVLRARYCGAGPSGSAAEAQRAGRPGSAVETEFNAVSVETGGRAPTPTPRLGPTTSSCGLCGSATLDDLRLRLHPLPALTPFPIDVLARATQRAAVDQDLFSTTGAVHAAAAFDRKGDPVLLREDIGRHNAVDKVVGRLLFDERLPAGDLGLYISGRASFEIVQKAWAAGFAAVVAVSAPSALAVETARVAGLQLAGFAREGRLNLYAPESFPSEAPG